MAIDLFASRPLITSYRRGALVIEAGGPDFVKYIDGGVRGDWQRGVRAGPEAGSRPVSLVRGLAAELYFPLDSDPGGIASSGDLQIRFRARSAVEKQLVSVFLNEHKLGDLSMPSLEWQSYSLKAPPETLVQGENKLRFYFRSAGDIAGYKSAAAFERFVIGASISEEAAFSTEPYAASKESRPALVVDAQSRLSYYLQLPEKQPALAFALAGGSKAQVRVRSLGEEASLELWQGSASETWEEQLVDLERFRGQIVRLDLSSEGPAAWSRPRILHEPTVSEAPELPSVDHIVLISISSLRSDRLREEVGRAFRRFADSSFGAQVQASVPSAGGAHATMMTGRLRVRGSIPEEEITLAEALQEAGFATALVSGNGFVNASAGFAQGFDSYDNPMRRHHHYGAATLWRQAKRFLIAHKGERSFVHVAAVEPHVPYRPSEESLAKEWPHAPLFSPAKTLSLADQLAKSRRLPSSQETAYVRALYDGTVADVGKAFNNMLSDLDEMQLEGNTVVVLAGDHGEEIWDRNSFGHGSTLYQEALLTPLAIRGPGLEGRRAPKLASSMDLHPTILAIAGIVPNPRVQGESLLGDPEALDARPFVSALNDGSRALRMGHFKLVKPAGAPLELYNLETDPREQTNVVAELSIVARALRIPLATAIAYQEVWSSARWGQPSRPTEAFARDQGM